MPIITTFLPSGYFSLSFDFRRSHLTQWPKALDASEAASCVQSNWRNVDRLLRELPDRDGRAENQDRTNCHFDDVAALFFRANQKRVGGFFMLIFWLICRACLFFHDSTLSSRAIGRDDNDHQISATPISERSNTLADDHALAFVMAIVTVSPKAFVFYLVCAL
jgi:hypothetical protein